MLLKKGLDEKFVGIALFYNKRPVTYCTYYMFKLFAVFVRYSLGALVSFELS